MPIKFISLNDKFIQYAKTYGFDAKQMKIQDYIPSKDKKTYYVSPANSLCFMDGGYDYALSRIIFPNIEKEVKNQVSLVGKKSLLGRSYLPIGSSIIIDIDESASLVVAPTMLLPQDVSETRNAYYATMSILYNVLCNCKENIDDIDIIFTSFCCGYGKMKEDDSLIQIVDGMLDYKEYTPTISGINYIICEPNLKEQPSFYENTEFLSISSLKITSH